MKKVALFLPFSCLVRLSNPPLSLLSLVSLLSLSSISLFSTSSHPFLCLSLLLPIKLLTLVFLSKREGKKSSFSLSLSLSLSPSLFRPLSLSLSPSLFRPLSLSLSQEEASPAPAASAASLFPTAIDRRTVSSSRPGPLPRARLARSVNLRCG